MTRAGSWPAPRSLPIAVGERRGVRLASACGAANRSTCPGVQPPRHSSGDKRGRRRRDAVVGEVGDQGAGAAGGGRRQPPGQVGRLAAGVDQEHGVEARRHGRDQALGELDGARVQVAQVGAEQSCLVGDRAADPRVRVADDRDVVVGVDVGPAGAVGQGGAAAADEVQRARSRSAGPARRRTPRRDDGAARRCREARSDRRAAR